MLKKFTLALFISLFYAGEIYSQQLPFTYTYTGKPRFQILTKRNNAVLGIINVELFPKIAPRHTRNFDSLVSQNFYDTTAFHRVIAGFMIQGGDPNSRHLPKPTWGYGEVGQPKVKAEFSIAKHKRGILSAARDNDINSATSQFFICHAASYFLDGNYSVYGRVTSGINFVDTIATAAKDGNDCPNDKIEMFVTYIGSNDTIPNPPLLSLPANDSSNVDTLDMVNLKWLPQSDAIFYHLDVSTDSTFATITYSTNTTGTNYVLWPAFPGNTKYFWRVNHNNGGLISAFSPVWHFKTQVPLNDVGIKQNVLSQNRAIIFPNPSSDKFTFSNIEKGNTIKIFDITGKLIYETVANSTSIIIDLEGKDKGVYTYRISNPEQEVSQGKLLMR